MATAPTSLNLTMPFAGLRAKAAVGGRGFQAWMLHSKGWRMAMGSFPEYLAALGSLATFGVLWLAVYEWRRGQRERRDNEMGQARLIVVEHEPHVDKSFGGMDQPPAARRNVLIRNHRWRAMRTRNPRGFAHWRFAGFICALGAFKWRIALRRSLFGVSLGYDDVGGLGNTRGAAGGWPTARPCTPNWPCAAWPGADRRAQRVATSACLARTAWAAVRRAASSVSLRSRSTMRRTPTAPISASTPR